MCAEDTLDSLSANGTYTAQCSLWSPCPHWFLRTPSSWNWVFEPFEPHFPHTLIADGFCYHFLAESGSHLAVALTPQSFWMKLDTLGKLLSQRRISIPTLSLHLQTRAFGCCFLDLTQWLARTILVRLIFLWWKRPPSPCRGTAVCPPQLPWRAVKQDPSPRSLSLCLHGFKQTVRL